MSNCFQLLRELLLHPIIHPVRSKKHSQHPKLNHIQFWAQKCSTSLQPFLGCPVKGKTARVARLLRIGSKTQRIKFSSQVFKLSTLKECYIWLVMLHQMSLIFYLKYISIFCHQTEDLEYHRLDKTDCGTLLFLGLSKCWIIVWVLSRSQCSRVSVECKRERLNWH